MLLDFISRYPNIKGKEQAGEESIYRRRVFDDDELPIDEPISKLFNRFRVSDNEKWPTFFKIHGHKYYLKIYKDKV